MPRQTEHGLSFFDASEAVREVSRAWNCRIHVHMTLPIRPDTGKAFDVRLAIMRLADDNKWYDSGGIQRSWPSHGAKTLAGLIHAMAYELDAMLQRQADDSMRAETQRRLRL